VLAAHRGAADTAGINWESAVNRKVGEEVKADWELTIERLAELDRVSRSGSCRFEGGPPAKSRSRHGSTRRHPAHRPGVAQLLPATRDHTRTAQCDWTVNPKRVYRLLREDNLLCSHGSGSSW
jgi:hypothetical protein